jgi:hypothetical protein
LPTAGVCETAMCSGTTCVRTASCPGFPCCGGVCTTCDDGNPCTDDSCDRLQGCVSRPNTDPCDDGNLCTTGDTCSGGVCVGTPVLCDEGNPCTVDACDPATGACTHPPVPDALVCLANDLAAQLAAADPAALGGKARKHRLTTRLRKVQAKLADAVQRPPRARRDYTRAFRGLLKLQRALQRGIVRQNFDVPLANQLIGSTAS